MFPFSGSRRHGNVAKFLGEYAGTPVSNGYGAVVHQGNRVHARRNFRERTESHLPLKSLPPPSGTPLCGNRPRSGMQTDRRACCPLLLRVPYESGTVGETRKRNRKWTPIRRCQDTGCHPPQRRGNHCRWLHPLEMRKRSLQCPQENIVATLSIRSAMARKHWPARFLPCTSRPSLSTEPATCSKSCGNRPANHSGRGSASSNTSGRSPGITFPRHGRPCSTHPSQASRRHNAADYVLPLFRTGTCVETQLQQSRPIPKTTGDTQK